MTRNSFLIQSDPDPVQTKIKKKTLKYFNYITLSSTDLFFLQLFDYIYVCSYIWKQSTRQAPSFWKGKFITLDSSVPYENLAQLETFILWNPGWVVRWPISNALLNDIWLACFTRMYGQRHVNHPPIDHPYKCHENTNHSRVPQLSKAPIPTSKWKYVPNLLQT